MCLHVDFELCVACCGGFAEFCNACFRVVVALVVHVFVLQIVDFCMIPPVFLHVCFLCLLHRLHFGRFFAFLNLLRKSVTNLPNARRKRGKTHAKHM